MHANDLIHIPSSLEGQLSFQHCSVDTCNFSSSTPQLNWIRDHHGVLAKNYFNQIWLYFSKKLSAVWFWFIYTQFNRHLSGKKKKKPTLKLLHVAILLVIIQNKGKNCKLRLKLQFRIISGSQTKGAQKHFCFTQSSKFGCLLFTLHCSASFLTAVKMVKSRQLKNYF